MASQLKEHVLRLRRTDNKSEHLLLNVGKTGRRDLDLKLIGTDKEVIFIGAIKESEIKSLQERNFTGDLEEWKNILCFALLRQRPEGTLPEFLQGVETVSSISGPTATITIRRNIGGITQRLGSVPLQQTGDEEIETLDWVDVAAATSDELRVQLETLQSSVVSQKDQIAKLSTELDMLVKAKKEHEDELLSKFAALLNAKKLKIRDQQRLLNGAQIDPVAAEEIKTARTSRAMRKAGASRRGKRKANSAAPPFPEEQDGQDDDVDTLDDEGGSRKKQETPEASDGDAATETEDEEEEAPKSSVTVAEPSQQSTQRRSQRVAEHMDIDHDEDLPPPRALPFSNRKPAPKSVRAPTPPPATDANDNHEDEETDDDEL